LVVGNALKGCLTNGVDSQFLLDNSFQAKFTV
jgi:hypothetical protein